MKLTQALRIMAMFAEKALKTKITVAPEDVLKLQMEVVHSAKWVHQTHLLVD